ncbi:transcription repressor OFP13 [Elaeis guineensis]|uniref:Transcription repressor n=1 Tax=Elaeis guineensis var. tenera TaxID=51953 RepID=A0A8N4F225_ELAGV|nr:transcription repressor OFP13 isoform X2 [Elaeis guineensis]
MGRQKLKSSFKSLQEAITSLKPVGPLCIQEAKTLSFREVDPYPSFNYVCYSPSTYSSSSSFSSGHSKLLLTQPHLEEDFLSSAPTTSTMSSFSLTAEPDEDPSGLPKGPISSTRFFFNPCTTKSIMEEAKAETDVLKILPFGDPWPKTTRVAPAGIEKASFHEESVALALASDDPYHDFRASMAEMVEAHQLREWPRLQELLHCYLRLNEEKTHEIIVLAFVDLLMHLVSKDKEGFPASFPTPCQPKHDC